MTQSERILRHLQECGPITAAEAMEMYGCCRLAARVSDLRRAGYPIRREFVTKPNRFGDDVTFARYFLEVG